MVHKKLIDICKHTPNDMGYIEWHNFIDKIKELPIHKQPKQIQCKICKHWFFKSEL